MTVDCARWLAAGAMLAIASPALAQRTDDNATTQADDAFGKSVGDEQIGIYNPFDVRGFSPVAAGNVRIEGLYFDQQTDLNDRIVDNSSVRVGISAQGYPFPAPTGIGDYTLRKPGAKQITSGVFRYGPFGGVDAQLDLQVPVVGETLGVAGGASLNFGQEHFGGSPNYATAGFVGAWRPAKDVEILPFWSVIETWSQEPQTLVFTAGDYLPPKVERGIYTGQPWEKNRATSYNYGVLGKARVAGFAVSGGVFRSIFEGKRNFTDLLFDVTPDRQTGDRVIIADRGNSFGSVSGELRVSRDFDDGPRRHTIVTTLRARDQRRKYGGSDVVDDLGPTTYGISDFEPEPVLNFGAKTRDRVTQKTVGLGYSLRWRGIGEFGVGIQKTDYRKTVNDPATVFPVSKSSPWLFNATAAVTVLPDFAFYGGYVRGLEESPVASDVAVNRNEAPPAIRTEQKDAGIRWSITPRLTAIAGVFDVSKPYFNLDPALRFRQLGSLRHRGVELSLAGEIVEGLNVVAGTVFLHARVSGEEVDSGLIGPKPVAAIERHSIASFDYRPHRTAPWSLDATIDSTGDRIANSANTLVVPPRAVLALGARYRFDLGGAKALVRAQVSNVFNNYGFGVGESGFFVYNLPRRLAVTIAADV